MFCGSGTVLLEAAGWLALLGVLGFIAMFSVSWGIVAWIIPEELMPLHLRANAIGLCVISNWVADYFTVATWLSITTAVSAAGGCLFYTVINAGALWFVWAMVPETRGVALEALEEPTALDAAAKPPVGGVAMVALGLRH